MLVFQYTMLVLLILGKSFCFKVLFLGAQLLFNFFLALPSAQRSQGNLKDITCFFFSFLLERRLQFKLSAKSFPLGTWVEISNSTLMRWLSNVSKS